MLVQTLRGYRSLLQLLPKQCDRPLWCVQIDFMVAAEPGSRSSMLCANASADSLFGSRLFGSATATLHGSNDHSMQPRGACVHHNGGPQSHVHDVRLGKKEGNDVRQLRPTLLVSCSHMLWIKSTENRAPAKCYEIRRLLNHSRSLRLVARLWGLLKWFFWCRCLSVLLTAPP